MRPFLAALAVIVLFVAVPTRASGETISIIVNKAHIIRLDKDAASVLVGDPRLARWNLDSPRRIFVRGRVPGETNLYVLDSDGNEILSADLIVVPNKDRHVTVNRGVAEATLSCAPRCAVVSAPEGAAGGGATPAAAAAAPTAAPAAAPAAQ